MGEQKGHADTSNSPGCANAGPRVVSRDVAPASSGDSGASKPARLFSRLLHIWFRLSRGLTLGVRAMVLDGEGRVFLVRHSYVPGWHMPGGGVEAGQSLVAALEMELREEANIVLTGPPEFFGVYHNAPAAPRDHIALFVVRCFEQSAPRQPDREIVEAGFFALDALPEATTAGTRRRLQEVLGGLVAASTW